MDTFDIQHPCRRISLWTGSPDTNGSMHGKVGDLSDSGSVRPVDVERSQNHPMASWQEKKPKALTMLQLAMFIKSTLIALWSHEFMA